MAMMIRHQKKTFACFQLLAALCHRPLCCPPKKRRKLFISVSSGNIMEELFSYNGLRGMPWRRTWAQWRLLETFVSLHLKPMYKAPLLFWRGFNVLPFPATLSICQFGCPSLFSISLQFFSFPWISSSSWRPDNNTISFVPGPDNMDRWVGDTYLF